ncbi:hypothetical protein DOTSEDRAFT_91007 [Dothistroma septosporum NZE10]|uniref:Uncharacterized protein n=1 Tax=Dothistroma septosporum (strain NZE10 / CBS 128990) TaxID=675120 RepID=N1PE90_DOTSN|nr:hypothetical protein DOTSEDRAFT_91007 [Dothistroma septosporum NZE10]
MAAQVPIVDVSCLFSLSGKSAIVTGGSGGLGLSMTTALASAGADIVSIELPNEPSSSAVASAISKAGRNLRQYHSDIRDSKHLHGDVKGDILLNCAGVQRRADADSFTDEEIEVVLDVNLKATLVSCQEFAKPLLKEGSSGKIINIASNICFIGVKNITPYAVSSGGVLYFHTPLTEQYQTDPKCKEFNDHVMMRTPAKRWGDPVDLAGAIIFLARSASDSVRGMSVVVDGGWLG